jgi:hypothetical protein
MWRNGFGVFYDFDDVPTGSLRSSPDGNRCAAFWVSQRKQDRYDEEGALLVELDGGIVEKAKRELGPPPEELWTGPPPPLFDTDD